MRLSRRAFVVGAAGVGLLAGCGRLPGQAEPAPTRTPRVGYLAFGERNRFDDQFRRGLLDLGYVEGQNIIIEYRFVQGSSREQVGQQATEQAAELVNLPVDVIAAALV